MTRYPIKTAEAIVDTMNTLEENGWEWRIHNPGPYGDRGEYAAVAAYDRDEDGNDHLVGYWTGRR